MIVGEYLVLYCKEAVKFVNGEGRCRVLAAGIHMLRRLQVSACSTFRSLAELVTQT